MLNEGKTFLEFLEESSTPERGRRRLSSRGPEQDKYHRAQNRQKTSDRIAVRKAGFKTKSQDGPHGSSDHYHSSSRHHSTNIASHKTQADYALSTVNRKHNRFSSSRKVEPTSSRVSGLRNIRKLLKTTRTAKPVHDISIHSDEGGISKNDSKRLISRGKSFKNERRGVSDALKNAGANTGDFAVGEPYGSMPHENPETGKKIRAKLYSNDYGVKLHKKTGKMVGRVGTFEQFMIEARRLKLVRMYHGTSTSSADKIKKSGFNTSDVYTSTDRETAQSFGKRHGEPTKVIAFSVPKKDIDTPGKVMKTDGQRGIDKWGREHYSTVMNPEYAKKHITKRKEGVIDAPKIPTEYRKQYFKDNPNSRFKRRTKTQPKRK